MFGRKKKPLFGNEIAPDCSYCVHNQGTGEECAFRQPGEDGTLSSCRAFQYDPLLRAPYVAPPLKKHDPSEFEL
jgi:hypothetical protein